MIKPGRHIHFIGIGGIGMSGIASILLKQGYAVSGSDLKESLIIRRLAESGAGIFYGHSPANINGADVVVYSSAIREDNPELAYSRDKGLIVLRRAEALASLMREKTCIAVSGAHGKTTTTALASHLLLQAGFCPTAAIGGILRNLEDNSCIGESRFFVAEADESDGTFLCYNPEYPIVTNIDREHLDYYRDWEDILFAYKRFIGNMKETGCLFACGDDPAVRQVSSDFKKRVIYFGLSPDNDFYPRNIVLDEFSSSFDYCFSRAAGSRKTGSGKPVARINLPLSGRHNISNSLAVIALGQELGISPEDIRKALASFQGTERRFQLKADTGGIRLIDDYGHHPSEIRATLLAAKNVKHKRLIVAFQPHRYSRTKFLMEEFIQSLSLADILLITDIYAASEEPIEGVSSEILCEKIKEKFPALEVLYLKKDRITARVLEMAMPGDLVITLGAGDIGKLSYELAEGIKGKNSCQRAAV